MSDKHFFPLNSWEKRLKPVLLHQKNTLLVSTALLNWFHEHKRDLPWRNTSDPYCIWLSEIILQQTQIKQGLPYYQRFINHFPTVFDLAKASEDEVLKLWQGLGYYSRARNLHHTAKTIVVNFDGVFPDSYKELKKLKGIGDYTASAIASICFEEPVAALDGNVFRVLSRVFGIDTPINSTEGRKRFKAKAEQCLDGTEPGNYNQAIMEFGAIQCKPKNPLCMICPLQNDCVAFQQNKVEKLPVKLNKTKIRKRHFNYLVFISPSKKTILQQRTDRDIWRNLYQFPLMETQNEVGKTDLLQIGEIKALPIKAKIIEAFKEKPIKHQLSHQKLMVKFWIIRTPHLPNPHVFKKPVQAVQKTKIENFAVPAVIEKFLDTFEF